MSLLSEGVISKCSPGGLGLHWTLGLGSEQDRKIGIPIARKKEGWALPFPLQLSWAANVPLLVFYPLWR